MKGQAMLEGILLALVFFGGAKLFVNYMQDNGVVSNLVSGPMTMIQGMVECGVWQQGPCGAGMHPMSTGRIISLKPSQGPPDWSW